MDISWLCWRLITRADGRRMMSGIVPVTTSASSTYSSWFIGVCDLVLMVFLSFGMDHRLPRTAGVVSKPKDATDLGRVKRFAVFLVGPEPTVNHGGFEWISASLTV